MSAIPSWASSGVPLFFFLLAVVFFRAQGTYWIGRGVAKGAISAQSSRGFLGSIARWFDGPVPRRGAALLDRWGLLIIPLCFLTVGIQTAVNAGAGLVRLKWRIYTLAMIPGCIIWALMYSLGLMALWVSAWKALAGSPWGVAGLVIIAIFAAGLLWHNRVRKRPDAECPVAPDAGLPTD